MASGFAARCLGRRTDGVSATSEVRRTAGGPGVGGSPRVVWGMLPTRQSEVLVLELRGKAWVTYSHWNSLTSRWCLKPQNGLDNECGVKQRGHLWPLPEEPPY